MQQIVLVVAFLGMVFAAPGVDLQDGTISYRPTIGGRIVGGEATTINDLPYQVAILRNGGQICGGSLIAPRIVLTAAHCVVPSVISALSQLNIRSGSTLHNSGGLRVAVSRLVIHSQYDDCDTCGLDYDIAVLHLASDAVSSGLPAAAVDLWDASATFSAGELGTVSGWGATSEGGSGSSQLRRVDVPVVSQANCRAVYGSIITNNMICAGFTAGGKDSCQGDSGGPFAIGNKLAGIVSFGAGCARPGLPGVYASVPGFRSWISTNAGI